MYFNLGLNPGEIGDFDIIEKDGQLHVFYLALPSHDAVGHLVSDDGINWKPLPTAIHTGDPDDFDGDQIWTMGVVKKGNTYLMLYTANQMNGKYQVTGLATSKDLIKWKKHAKNPVAAPDPRWYEAKQHGKYRVDWRDPQIIERDGVLHAFLCARQNKGLRNNRGCAGYFTSRDGYKWTVQPPACTPGNCFDYECPSVFQLGSKYYMVAIHGGHNRMTHRVADKVQGPYLRPHDDSLLPGSNMSVRPCAFNGETYLWHWNRGARDWNPRYPGFACLSSPKRAYIDAAGELAVESFDWKCMHDGKPQALTAAAGKGTCGTWKWHDRQLQGQCGPGYGNWLTHHEHEDFEISAEVDLGTARGACEFGFAIRTDETGDQHISARCVPGRSRAELVKQIHNRLDGPESLWRGRSVLQEYHLQPTANGKYRIRLIAFGPNIEFNVNGRILLSHLTLPRRKGKVGLFLEDGRGTFSNVRITNLQAPRTRWE